MSGKTVQTMSANLSSIAGKRSAKCQSHRAHGVSRLLAPQCNAGVGNPAPGQAGRGHQRDAGSRADEREDRREAGVLGADLGLSGQHIRAERKHLVAQAMTIGEQQELVETDVRDIDLVFQGQWVSVRQRDPERLIVERGLGEACIGYRRCQDRRVEPPLDQFGFEDVRHVFGQPELDLGQTPGDRRQQHGRQVRTDGRNHAEPQWTGQRIDPGPGGLLDQVRRGEQPLGMADDLFARRRDPDGSLGAFEERDPQVVFELADLTAERRLTDMAGFCRATEVAQLGYCHGVSEIADVHQSH